MSGIGPVVGGIQGLVGVVIAILGTTKLVGTDGQVETFERLGYPQWFRVVTGGLELFGAVGLLLAFVTTGALALAASGVLAVVLTGAIASHRSSGDPVSEMAPASVLLLLVLAVTVQHARILA